jgi:hypothetical protein
MLTAVSPGWKTSALSFSADYACCLASSAASA